MNVSRHWIWDDFIKNTVQFPLFGRTYRTAAERPASLNRTDGKYTTPTATHSRRQDFGLRRTIGEIQVYGIGAVHLLELVLELTYRSETKHKKLFWRKKITKRCLNWLMFPNSSWKHQGRGYATAVTSHGDNWHTGTLTTLDRWTLLNSVRY